MLFAIRYLIKKQNCKGFSSQVLTHLQVCRGSVWVLLIEQDQSLERLNWDYPTGIPCVVFFSRYLLKVVQFKKTCANLRHINLLLTLRNTSFKDFVHHSVWSHTSRSSLEVSLFLDIMCALQGQSCTFDI